MATQKGPGQQNQKPQQKLTRKIDRPNGKLPTRYQNGKRFFNTPKTANITLTQNFLSKQSSSKFF